MARRLAVLICAIALFGATGAGAGEGRFSGFAAVEARVFYQDPAASDQDKSSFSPSVILQPEYRYSTGDGDDRLTIVPFLRIDFDDDNRTHADLRELNWRHRGDDWGLLVGVGKVFWGVAESRHLVDIINQTDLVENLDEEDKLGQPMVNLSIDHDWGMVGLFVLPGFRTRTFPDRDARLRGAVPVETGDPVFESGARRWHVDFAARWWHTLGDLDVGIAHFHGTGREPRLVPAMRGGRSVLIPHYDQIDQTSVDAQYTYDGWLVKFEGLTRSGQGDRFYAVVGGFEHTLYGAAGTKGDLGLLAEYLYDGRDARAPATSFDDDIFVALRFVFNDAQSTSVLAGAFVDRDTKATLLSIEAERRLGQAWKLEAELRAFLNVPPGDGVLGGIRDDDHVLVRLSRFF